MSKYNGFTIEQMLVLLERRGHSITLETMGEFGGDDRWRLLLWVDGRRHSYRANTLFGVTMRAFKPFIKQATKERAEKLERLQTLFPNLEKRGTPMSTVGQNNTKLTIPGGELEVAYQLVADVQGGVRMDSRPLNEQLDDYRECYTAKDGEDFYHALPNCGDDQVIICRNVSPEWLERIEQEYGIHH